MNIKNKIQYLKNVDRYLNGCVYGNDDASSNETFSSTMD